jgi:hypothetical protein
MPKPVDAVDAAFLSEIEGIEADIKARPDPRQTRLAHLRASRESYLQGAAAIETAPGTTAAAFDEVAPRQRRFFENPVDALAREIEALSAASYSVVRSGRQPSPERLRALSAAHEFLQGKTIPTRTSLILEHLESRGITISGEVPVNNLSAMLSNDDRFQANGRSGWTLVKKEAAA